MSVKGLGIILILYGHGLCVAAPLDKPLKSQHPKDGIYPTPPAFTDENGAYDSFIRSELDTDSGVADALKGSDYRQQPPQPSAQLVGLHVRDLAGPSRLIMEDGSPDVWIRFYPRGLKATQGRGVGSPRGNRLRSLILRTSKSTPSRQWDTLEGSTFPLLQVEGDGRLANGPGGSVAGLSLDDYGVINLYFSDDNLAAGRRTPLELEIVTEDGAIKIPVKPYCAITESQCL